MNVSESKEREVFQFIRDYIESVPHLEALLLLWNTHPANWGAEELASRLYVRTETAHSLLRDLNRDNLIAEEPASSERFVYRSKSAERDELIHAVNEVYRRQLVRISQMIHAKGPAAVRDFARAFRFTKERE